jgi:hypothetical protein
MYFVFAPIRLWTHLFRASSLFLVEFYLGTPIPLELDLPPGDREKLHALLN